MMPIVIGQETGATTAKSVMYELAKRIMDVAIAVVILAVAAPFILLIMAAVAIDSGRPVFYVRPIVGRQGRGVGALKFRTMRALGTDPVDQTLVRLDVGIELPPGAITLPDDPRITRIGAWLRKTSLDELPQLFNVLRGEMSLVGPRMFTIEEWQALSDYTRWQRDALSVGPGITGLWQVTGRRNLGYEDRVALDLQYVDHRSLGLDIAILLRTVPAVLARRGAF